MPPIPRNINRVDFPYEWGETWLNDRFLLSNDRARGVAVFATDENLRALANAGTLYMDATFRSCPAPYRQVFTIHGNVHGFVVPLVHALMTRKTIGHYSAVLRAVKRAVRGLRRRLRPTTVVVDFEAALHVVLGVELPHARISACYFHFTQSLWRRVQEVGLAAVYMRNMRVKRLIQKVMAIGQLPLAVVRLSFQALQNARRTRRLAARHPAIDDFLDYVRDNYIIQGALFLPATWNCYQRGMSTRTNNIVEAYHRALSGAVQARHPSLWTFVVHMKDRQALAEQDLTAAARGNPPPIRKRKWRDLEQSILRLKQQYTKPVRRPWSSTGLPSRTLIGTNEAICNLFQIRHF